MINAIEESTYKIIVAFAKEDGTDLVPISATWTLTDSDGNVINSRQNITITGLAPKVPIYLSGKDLSVPGENDILRVLLIKAFYDDGGIVRPLNGQYKFVVKDCVGIRF